MGDHQVPIRITGRSPRQINLPTPFSQKALAKHVSDADEFKDLGDIKIVREEGKRNKIFSETIDLDSVSFHYYVTLVLVQSIAILREGS